MKETIKSEQCLNQLTNTISLAYSCLNDVDFLHFKNWEDKSKHSKNLIEGLLQSQHTKKTNYILESEIREYQSYVNHLLSKSLKRNKLILENNKKLNRQTEKNQKENIKKSFTNSKVNFERDNKKQEEIDLKNKINIQNGRRINICNIRFDYLSNRKQRKYSQCLNDMYCLSQQEEQNQNFNIKQSFHKYNEQGAHIQEQIQQNQILKETKYSYYQVLSNFNMIFQKNSSLNIRQTSEQTQHQEDFRYVRDQCRKLSPSIFEFFCKSTLKMKRTNTTKIKKQKQSTNKKLRVIHCKSLCMNYRTKSLKLSTEEKNNVNKTNKINTLNIEFNKQKILLTKPKKKRENSSSRHILKNSIFAEFKGKKIIKKLSLIR